MSGFKKWTRQMAKKYPLTEDQKIERRESRKTPEWDTEIICINGIVYYYDNGHELSQIYDKLEDELYADIYGDIIKSTSV